MYLKSTLLLLAFLFVQTVYSQTQNYGVYLTSPSENGYLCGGGLIIGNFTSYSFENQHEEGFPNITFGEGNEFYLEVVDSTITTNNLVKIKAQSLIFSGNIKAVFELPKTLQVGKKYTLRLISTSPSIISLPQQIIYGLERMPFTADFQQTIIINGKNPTSYNVPIKIVYENNVSTNNLNGTNNSSFSVRLSNGQTGNTYLNYSALNLVAKDSVETIKIDEIKSSCGVVGSVRGETKLIWKKDSKKLYIENASRTNSTCIGSNLKLKVLGTDITSSKKFTLKISKDYNFIGSNVLLEQEVELKDNFLEVKLPTTIVANTYYYVQIKSNEVILSNTLEFYINRAVEAIYLNTHILNKQQIQLYANQLTSSGQYQYSGLTYLEINKVDVTPLIGGNNYYVNLTRPKKDTTFTITRAITECGEVKNLRNTVRFNANNDRFLELAPTKNSVCEGETLKFFLNEDDENFLKELRTNAYIYVSGYAFNEKSNKYDGNYLSKYFFIGEGTFDSKSKTLTYKIPSNLSKEFYIGYGNQKYVVQDTYFFTNFSYKNSVVYKSNISVRVKLSPIVSLLQREIVLNGIGYAKIPVKYIGKDTTTVALNDNKYSLISHHFLPSNCSDCSENAGLEKNMQVFVNKTTTFRITNVENSCAVGEGSGTTTVIVKEAPSLVIDESKMNKNYCLNSRNKISIPFSKLGNWSDLSKNLTARIDYIGYYGYNSTSYINFTDESELSFYPNPNYYTSRIEVTIYNQSSVTSQTAIINVSDVPNYYYLTSGSAEMTYKDGVYYYYFSSINSNNYSFKIEANVPNIYAEINNKKYSLIANYYNSQYSSLNINLIGKNDSTFTISKLQNDCGSIEINKKIKVIRKNTVFGNSYENSYNSEIVPSNCPGTKRIIRYSYVGETPSKDSVIVQIGKKISDNAYLSDYFDVPTQEYGANRLIYSIPDTCSGEYFWRIRSYDKNMLSQVQFLGMIQQKPTVKLTSSDGSSEVSANTNAILKLTSNLEKNGGYFNVLMNDGMTYSNYTFTHYISKSLDDSTKKGVSKIINQGLPVFPKKDTLYKIVRAYNECGVGTVEGSVRVKVNPSIEIKYTNSTFKQDFCVGDSLTIKFDYYSDFPKDTLMGVYLNNYYNSKYKAELLTFKNKPSEVKIKIPASLEAGYYLLQVRKTSRKNEFIGSKAVSNEDSITTLKAKQGFDSNKMFLYISTPPNVELSGNAEIFVGQSALVTISPKNSSGQNSVSVKDTIYYNWSMPNYYLLSDGSEWNVLGRTNFEVKPNKSTTYTLVSAKNYCGLGKASGSATVKVLSKTDVRIESVGFQRSYVSNNAKQYYYQIDAAFCQGEIDSFDVKVFGLNSINLDKVQILLSDKNGANYSKITKIRTKIIDSVENVRTLRTVFRVPNEVTYGFDYKIRTIIEDDVLNSNSNPGKIFIYELPTATLTGIKQFVAGEKVEGLVKLTGDSPWYFTIKDDADVVAFNTVPTRNDTLNKFKDFKFKPIYTPEYKIDFLPNKTTTFKVSAVYNDVCGLGKIGTETLKVELVLASEPTNDIEVTVFPNPTLENLNLNLENLHEPTNVELYSTSGVKLIQFDFSEAELKNENIISMKQYPSGNYYLKVSNKKLTKTFRVSKF